VADGLAVLLDQNVPRAVGAWPLQVRPSWTVFHASEVGLTQSKDPEVFAWAQAHQAIVVTFDEDFADQRSFPVGHHYGVIRLHVWPTTIEETQNALERLLTDVTDPELAGALVIVDRFRIRVRPGQRPNV
jgi:predicted nuclease of predicted toxin-antitoxin system